MKKQKLTFIDCSGQVVRIGVCVKCGETKFVCIYPKGKDLSVCNHCLYSAIKEKGPEEKPRPVRDGIW